MIVDHEIIKFKTNHFPKGLVPLEQLFGNSDVYVNPSIHVLEGTTIDCNIGTNKEPKLVKISKDLSKEQRKRYINLMKEYVDVFLGNMRI